MLDLRRQIPSRDRGPDVPAGAGARPARPGTLGLGQEHGRPRPGGPGPARPPGDLEGQPSCRRARRRRDAGAPAWRTDRPRVPGPRQPARHVARGRRGRLRAGEPRLAARGDAGTGAGGAGAGRTVGLRAARHDDALRRREAASGDRRRPRGGAGPARPRRADREPRSAGDARHLRADRRPGSSPATHHRPDRASPGSRPASGRRRPAARRLGPPACLRPRRRGRSGGGRAARAQRCLGAPRVAGSRGRADERDGGGGDPTNDRSRPATAGGSPYTDRIPGRRERHAPRHRRGVDRGASRRADRPGRPERRRQVQPAVRHDGAAPTRRRDGQAACPAAGR